MDTSTTTQTYLAQDTYLPLLCESFLIDRKAANVAGGTLRFYTAKLTKFLAYCDSQQITQIDQITARNIREYILSLESAGHNPGGIHAHYRTLKTFLRWYEDEVEPPAWKNPIAKVRPPRVSIEPLEPASLSDVSKMLDTCKGRAFTALRDKAIVLTLLDTGLRASELLDIDIDDIDTVRGDILVKRGKGRKPRVVFCGKKTRKALKQYLLIRTSPDPALFVTLEGGRIEYDGLRALMVRRAHRAGVKPPSLHSFRRAFALQFLRNGGDLNSLRRLMGHSDLKVLERYLDQTTEDLATRHQAFGPIDHLNFS